VHVLEPAARPSFGWYESVAYEEPGHHAKWLRLDEMMNAVMSFSVETAGYMSGTRLGLTTDDADEDNVEPPAT
jgi:hypothetical protein